jgi:SNF2 family DNA or RNA helicase
MGYGKTAIIIALVFCTVRAGAGCKLSENPKRQKLEIGATEEVDCAGENGDAASEFGSVFSTNATLIITPPNLFHQWITEFKKFLGGENGGLHLLPIEDMHQFRLLTCMDIQRADVVVVSSSFFLSPTYQEHLSREARLQSSAGPAAIYEALRDRAKAFAVECNNDGLTSRKRKVSDAAPVVLELFQWQRVVFDEFHKCVGETERHSASWRALHEIKARFRWGLTATPDLTLPLRISEMAALLHVFVPPDNRIEAQRFLDLWVRSDEWDVSSIPVANHVITVQQTPIERALYLAKKRWLEGQCETEAELLPFCSHFDPSALDNSGTAGAAVEKVLRQQKLEREKQKDEIADINYRLHTARSDDPYILRQRLAAAEQKLNQMGSTITFLMQTMDYIAKLDAGSEHECSICLADCSAGEVSVTRCGHIFCTDCIHGIVKAGGGGADCPTCRQRLASQDIDPILKLLKSQAVASDVDCGKYGSKIARIIDELRRIHNEDRNARVLVFVQWNALLLKLEAALEHYGVHCVALRGGVADRQRTISAFAEGTKRYVLLMAMEHDDSGLNLTCSNHVFFVHPMAAEPEVIRACERQALGRVRRRGQTREVHLYRFVCSGTVEEAHAARDHEILFSQST